MAPPTADATSCLTVSGGGDQRVRHLVFEHARQFVQVFEGRRRTVTWETAGGVSWQATPLAA